MKRKAKIASERFRNRVLVVLAAVMLLPSACMVGPKYRRPAAPAPPAYKEPPPSDWKQAQPNDGAIRGKWWEIYNDPELNALEEQVNISNQNVLAAEAQFREARDAVRVAYSSLFPTLVAAPSFTRSQTSATLFNVRAGNLTSGLRSIYNFPVDLSYQADIWGSIRPSVRASAETAQATFAQLKNARLSFHATLAQAYFALPRT